MPVSNLSPELWLWFIYASLTSPLGYPKGIYNFTVQAEFFTSNHKLYLTPPTIFLSSVHGHYPPRCAGPQKWTGTTHFPSLPRHTHTHIHTHTHTHTHTHHTTHISISGLPGNRIGTICTRYSYIKNLTNSHNFHLHVLVQAWIIFRLDYYSISQTNPLSSILKRVINLKYKSDYVCSVLSLLQWFPISLWVKVKVLYSGL